MRYESWDIIDQYNEYMFSCIHNRGEWGTAYFMHLYNYYKDSNATYPKLSANYDIKLN